MWYNVFKSKTIVSVKFTIISLFIFNGLKMVVPNAKVKLHRSTTLTEAKKIMFTLNYKVSFFAWL